jgi:hypothetical protein
MKSFLIASALLLMSGLPALAQGAYVYNCTTDVSNVKFVLQIDPIQRTIETNYRQKESTASFISSDAISSNFITGFDKSNLRPGFSADTPFVTSVTVLNWMMTGGNPPASNSRNVETIFDGSITEYAPNYGLGLSEFLCVRAN